MDHLLAETYFEWLKSEAFEKAGEAKEYEGVLHQLHDIPFYWTIVSDDNRAGDALTFRQHDFLDFQDYLEDMNQMLLGQWATAAPSVLEVLLGISRRWGYYFGGDVHFYFGHLFRNMGFDRYPGSVLTGSTNERLRTKVDRWMSRQFQPDGRGSPFPIQHPSLIGVRDMREVDIWGQMNAYSAEHFQ